MKKLKRDKTLYKIDREISSTVQSKIKMKINELLFFDQLDN
jgi:hypothetical protein